MLKRLFILLLSCSCHSVYSEWYSHTFDVMGTEAKVEFWHKKKSTADELISQVVKEMQRIDKKMSFYKEDSEISKVNKRAHKKTVKISKELFSLLQESKKYYNLTEGAFDITFASVGHLYDYRNKVSPTKEEIKKAKQGVGFKHIKLIKKTSSVRFNHAMTKIDLGGIAKGYAVDRCLHILKEAGVSSAFVSAGGDSRVLGGRQERLWNIGIRHPRKEDAVVTKIPIENLAISTSGDYERFYIEDGKRFHHILDPKTSRSAKNSVSVSIIANESIRADALSTGVFVMGVTKGMALINQLEDVSAIIIDSQGKLHYSHDLLAQ